MQLFDHLLDLQRRGLGASGQAAHFVGDHRESTARFTGSRRFDRRVERQQIGLLRDALDHFQDLPDVHRLVVEHLNVGARGTDLAGQFVHHFNGALHHLATVLGLLSSGGSLLRGIGGVMGDFLGGGAQLIDRGGHAVGAGGLIVEIAQRRIGRVQHPSRPLVDPQGRRRHLANRVMNAFDKAIERGGQLADLIPGLHGQATGQVAFAEGDVLHDPRQHLQGAGDALRGVPDQQQAEQGRAAAQQQFQCGTFHALGIELLLQGCHRRQ